MDYAKAKELALTGVYLLPSSSYTIWNFISIISTVNDPTAILFVIPVYVGRGKPNG
jgi:hypothetical protein